MGGARHTVLYVGDEGYAADLAPTLERHETMRVAVEPTAADGVRRLDREAVDCVVAEATDRGEWESLLADAGRVAPEVPVVLLASNPETLDAESDVGVFSDPADCVTKRAVSDCHRLLASRISNAVAAAR